MRDVCGLCAVCVSVGLGVGCGPVCGCAGCVGVRNVCGLWACVWPIPAPSHVPATAGISHVLTASAVSNEPATAGISHVPVTRPGYESCTCHTSWL